MDTTSPYLTPQERRRRNALERRLQSSRSRPASAPTDVERREQEPAPALPQGRTPWNRP
jgi:hypothetical protein